MTFVLLLEKSVLVLYLDKDWYHDRGEYRLEVKFSHDLPELSIQAKLQLKFNNLQHDLEDKFVSFIYLGGGAYAVSMKLGDLCLANYSLTKKKSDEGVTLIRSISGLEARQSIKHFTKIEEKKMRVFFGTSSNKIVVFKIMENEGFLDLRANGIKDVMAVDQIVAYDDSSISGMQAFTNEFLVTACETGVIKLWRVNLDSKDGFKINLIQRISDSDGSGIIHLASNHEFIAVGGSNGYSYVYGLDKTAELNTKGKRRIKSEDKLLRQYRRIKTSTSQASSLTLNNENKIFGNSGESLKVWNPTYLMKECVFDDTIVIPKRTPNRGLSKEREFRRFSKLKSGQDNEGQESKIRKLEYFKFRDSEDLTKSFDYILAFNDYKSGLGYLSLWVKGDDQGRGEFKDVDSIYKNEENNDMDEPKRTHLKGEYHNRTSIRIEAFPKHDFHKSSTSKNDLKPDKTLNINSVRKMKESKKFKILHKFKDNWNSCDFNSIRKTRSIKTIAENTEEKEFWGLAQEFNFLVNQNGWAVSGDGSYLAIINQTTLELLIFEVWSQFENSLNKLQRSRTDQEAFDDDLSSLFNSQNEVVGCEFYLKQSIRNIFKDQFWRKNCLSINSNGSLIGVIDYADESFKIWGRLEGSEPNSGSIFKPIKVIFKLQIPKNIKIPITEYFSKISVNHQSKKTKGKGDMPRGSIINALNGINSNLNFIQIKIYLRRLDGVDIISFFVDQQLKAINKPKFELKSVRLRLEEWNLTENLIYFSEKLGLIASEVQEKMTNNQILKKFILRKFKVSELKEKELKSSGMKAKETENKTQDVKEFISEVNELEKMEVLSGSIHQILDFSYFGIANSMSFQIKTFRDYVKRYKKQSMIKSIKRQTSALKSLKNQNSVNKNDPEESAENILLPHLTDSRTLISFVGDSQNINIGNEIYMKAFFNSVSNRDESFYRVYKLSKDLKFVLVMKLESEQGLCFDHHLRFVANASIKENNKVYINESKYEAGKLPRCSNLYRYLIEVFEGDKNFINPDKLDSLCEYLKKNESAYNELVIHKEINIILLCVLSESAATLKKGLDYFGYFKTMYSDNQGLANRFVRKFVRKVNNLLKKNKTNKETQQKSPRRRNTIKEAFTDEDPLELVIKMNNLSLMDQFADYFDKQPISNSHFSEEIFLKFLKLNSKNLKKVALNLFLVPGMTEKGLHISDAYPLGREGFKVIKTKHFERGVYFKEALKEKASEVQGRRKQQSVQYLTTSIPVDLRLLSNFTKMFSEFYMQAEPSLVTTRVRYLIRHIWLRNRLWVFIYSMIHWISLIALLGWVVIFERYQSLFFIGVLGLTIITTFETISLYGASNTLRFANKVAFIIVDVITILALIGKFTNATRLIYTHLEFTEPVYNFITTVLVTFHLSRSLIMWRFWDQTRYLTAMIIQTYKDMASFITILLFTAFSFTMIQIQVYKKLLGTRELTLFDSFKISYGLAYGNFPDGTMDMSKVEYFYLILSTIFLPLVLMNLFVAIIWDTFSEVKADREVTDYREMATVIYEFSCVANYLAEKFHWEVIEGYYHVLVPSEDNENLQDHREEEEDFEASESQRDQKSLIELGNRTVDLLISLEHSVKQDLGRVHQENKALQTKLEAIEKRIGGEFKSIHAANRELNARVHKLER